MTRETLVYSEWFHRIMKPSQYALNTQVEDEDQSYLTCPACGREHRAERVRGRTAANARACAACNGPHAGTSGDFWAETSNSQMRWRSPSGATYRCSILSG